VGIGTGDFTIEMWFKTTSTTQYAQLIGNETSGAATGFSLLINNSANDEGDIAVYPRGTPVAVSSSGGWADDEWHHLAVTRAGETVRLFVDGSIVDSGTDSGSWSGDDMWVGANNQFSGRDFEGYIDDLRIVKGLAVYTGPFIPPTGPLAVNATPVTPLPFSPTSLTNLAAWYDASDAATLAQNSDGTTAASAEDDPVGYWQAKAGTANLTQSVNNNRPTLKLASQGGKATLLFDGANDYLLNAGLNLSSSSAFTLMAVVRYNDPEGGIQLSVAFAGGGPSYAGGALEINRSGEAYGGTVGSVATGDEVNVAGGTPNSSFVVHGLRFDEPDISVFVGGTGVATGTRAAPAGSDAGLHVGAYDDGIVPASCNIAEIVYYTRALTSGEIAQLQTYFDSKWGL
jgi:hypothetical protein